MSRAVAETARKRIKTARAVSILGLEARTGRDMALRGEIPGAAKPRGIWTFDLALLEAYNADRERIACQKASEGRRLQGVVSGATISSMAGFKPAAPTSNGRYAQTIQALRKLAGQRSAPAR
jgi:hypothetical protein